MDNITNIDQLVKFDEEIKKMALTITQKDYDLANDIVQEFYIAYIKKQPLNINRFYIWAGLNNQYITYIRKNNVRQKYVDNLPQDETDNEYNYNADEEYQNKENNLMQLINSHQFFDKELVIYEKDSTLLSE